MKIIKQKLSPLQEENRTGYERLQINSHALLKQKKVSR